MALKIFQHIQNLLKNSERFTDKEENIFVHTILEAIENLDPEFIGLLLGDEKAKEQFFIRVEGALVLNQNKLIEFFTMNEFSKNSYTSYTNKIGLIKKDSFIKKFDDVVLAWPHKDCVLEGGQSKDDEKNNEVFYNEILSRDEIDRLFEPKALTNIKRYSEKWKNEFLADITKLTSQNSLVLHDRNESGLELYENSCYRLFGLPFYNYANEHEFKESFSELVL
jgi:adenine-specific DNA-methyltransferase